MALKHNLLVEKNTQKMLESDTIGPISIVWSFLVVTSTEKEREQRVFVDYLALNTILKDDS